MHRDRLDRDGSPPHRRRTCRSEGRSPQRDRSLPFQPQGARGARLAHLRPQRQEEGALLLQVRRPRPEGLDEVPLLRQVGRQRDDALLELRPSSPSGDAHEPRRRRLEPRRGALRRAFRDRRDREHAEERHPGPGRLRRHPSRRRKGEDRHRARTPRSGFAGPGDQLVRQSASALRRPRPVSRSPSTPSLRCSSSAAARTTSSATS